MSTWEDTFTSWAKGPGTTEQTKCENAESAIKKAIAADKKLSVMDITVFPQGSYRNRTNVKQDSDVDICVRLNSTFFDDYPTGTTREHFGNISGTITFSEFKNLVGAALVSYFGESAVTRGNKAFDVHANSYRIDADVVATFEHRRYQLKQDGTHYYLSGIGFDTDAGARVTNWPDQNYTNGLSKHENTSRRYRKMVRILKRLRNLMQEEKVAAADNIASCLIEALVWNVPQEGFGHDTYVDDVRYVLAHTCNNTRKDEDCKEWGEVNELKYLFRPSQPWTRLQANSFLNAAWKRVGFE
jgi:hypothetical protein